MKLPSKNFSALCKESYQPILERAYEQLRFSIKEITEEYASRGFSSPQGAMYVEMGKRYKEHISMRAAIIFDGCCQAYKASTPKPNIEEFSKELSDAITREQNRALASGEARFDQFNAQFNIPDYQKLLEQFKNEVLSEGRRTLREYASTAVAFVNEAISEMALKQGRV